MASSSLHTTSPEHHSITSGLQWYVVHCQARRERYTAQNLRQQLDLTVYLPEVQHYSNGVLEETPLFSSYLFVKADLCVTALSRINATEGVLRLVAFDDTPLPVPSEVVHAIYQRIAALDREGGVIDYGFKPGEAVAISGGAMRGIEAIFLGPAEPSARVWVLIELLGRIQNIEIDVGEIVRYDQDALAPLEAAVGGCDRRLTRGKGRRIRDVR
ncbi:hypothetical protein K2Z83_25330 [Oscillochloris sp. ZM17-4]|uniref:transcription termination/antitermination protein NusG n=1 Tax=Oscillochloris sp. ZM17-4 TaxID=2866714 RepID=UPI001C7342CC|nr:transcription termination/antitermination NusG family protein [Oscillochloris sp. ZM17-4]MBX0330981.1 hypothetical protein [Oscillochloris sp. ZM17-4]